MEPAPLSSIFISNIMEEAVTLACLDITAGPTNLSLLVIPHIALRGDSESQWLPQSQPAVVTATAANVHHHPKHRLWERHHVRGQR